MEDIWKPSKKEKWSNAHPPSSSSSKFALPRSFSAKGSSSNSPSGLTRSGSQSSAPSSKGSLSQSWSRKGPSITHKCSNLAKEQKAKFYIMKRCVAMLIRWHKHDNDS